MNLYLIIDFMKKTSLLNKKNILMSLVFGIMKILKKIKMFQKN